RTSGETLNRKSLPPSPRLRRARESLQRECSSLTRHLSSYRTRGESQMSPLRTLAGKLPPPWGSEAAAAAALRAHDDVCSTLPAAGHTDRVFEALHAVSGAEGPLDRRLTHVRRKNPSCCRRTIHIETRAVQGCLNCHPLLALHHLLLRLASYCGKGADECQKHVSLFHISSSNAVWFCQC